MRFFSCVLYVQKQIPCLRNCWNKPRKRVHRGTDKNTNNNGRIIYAAARFKSQHARDIFHWIFRRSNYRLIRQKCQNVENRADREIVYYLSPVLSSGRLVIIGHGNRGARCTRVLATLTKSVIIRSTRNTEI